MEDGGGAETEMRDEVGPARREGGRGKESARLKRIIVDCSWERTWRRVRRWGREGGSVGWAVDGDAPAAVVVDVLGPGGCSEVEGDAAGFVLSLALPVMFKFSRPAGRNFWIDSVRGPFEERVSARDMASPRRSSTS